MPGTQKPAFSSVGVCVILVLSMLQVFSWCHEMPPDGQRPLNTYYDPRTGSLSSYVMQVTDELTPDSFSSGNLPVVQTSSIQMGLDYFIPWLDQDNKQPFILVGPEGCGKGCVDGYYLHIPISRSISDTT